MNFRFYSPELRSKEWPEWHNADELVIGSRVALGSYNWIRWVGASIVPFLNNPLWLCFCFDDGCLIAFNSLHIPPACACLILSQSIFQDWHVQPSTPPSRREIMRNHFFHRVLYGCPLLVLPAFGSTPSTLTRRRLNGLQHPWLFFRL